MSFKQPHPSLLPLQGLREAFPWYRTALCMPPKSETNPSSLCWLSKSHYAAVAADPFEYCLRSSEITFKVHLLFFFLQNSGNIHGFNMQVSKTNYIVISITNYADGESDMMKRKKE